MESRVVSLSEKAVMHRAVRHPYLFKLEIGDLPDPVGALKDLAHQYFAYSAQFHLYLDIVISKLTNADHRQWLTQNLMEEKGHIDSEELALLKAKGIREEWVQDIPHPMLFRRFQRAIGVTEAWVQTHPYCPEVITWREKFTDLLSSGTEAQAVGALGLGTESIVRSIYKPVVIAIKRYLNIPPEDSVFFPLHCEVDDNHGLTLIRIAEDLGAESEESYHELRHGMLTALDIRAEFWDGMLTRAQHMPTVSQERIQIQP